MRGYTSSHWGLYEIHGEGAATRLLPFRGDPQPSPIGLRMLEAYRHGPRVRRPALRRSVARHGPGAAPGLRGLEDFVEVPWDEALDMAAEMLRGTIAAHGNEAIFGGSYGWASAGRFHHAQSQIHRFLNCAGGYVRSVDTYSLGAARVLMPHVVAPIDVLLQEHTSWDVLAAHTQLFVAFGGVPLRNAQMKAGGHGEHVVAAGLVRMAQAGVGFVNVGPARADLVTGGPVEWIPLRPHTDAAFMLALAHTLLREGLHDEPFLQRHCTGFELLRDYLLGRADGVPKDAGWAQGITGVPAERIAGLARRMAGRRTLINVAWALQRADHGEQPFWMAVTLAAMLGQVGLPGGGFGLGYGATGMMGQRGAKFAGPVLPQGRNPVQAFIPVARIADMLERPGEPFAYDGGTYCYPQVDLVYWAGGNPFHHHQDLARLVAAWRRPSHVLVHEQFWTATARMADVVLPATSPLEREDIGFAVRERYMVATRAAIPPVGQARDDFEIFRALAARLGMEHAYTEGLSASDWQRRLYEDCRPRALAAGISLPGFDEFREAALLDLGSGAAPVVMLQQFRRDPAAAPLPTPSGRIELASAAIAGFGLPDCPGHPAWIEPSEWLGAPQARQYPLHLLSQQPAEKLHSQLDHGAPSRAAKRAGRQPLQICAADAQARGIGDGDLVRIWNGRGACIAVAEVSEGLREGVVKLATGAWFDPDSWAEPTLDKHGNPNILTADRPASSLSQGCAAQSCLVQVARFDGDAPAVTAHGLPPGVAA